MELFKQEDLPIFSGFNPDETITKLNIQIEENKTLLDHLLELKQPDWDSFMQPMEEMGDKLNKIWSTLGHLHSVLESPSIRKAYNEGLEQLTTYHTALSQNEQIYQSIKKIALTTTDFNAAQQKSIENDLRDFKLSGVQLNAEKKAALAQLNLEISKLTTLFAEHVLDATHAYSKHITARDDLEGLPQHSIQMAEDLAKERNLPGFILTLDYPMYSSAIKFLHNRALRRELYEAYSTRASDQGPDALRFDNTPVMNAILDKRQQMAKLVGFNNFAEYSLATKMAHTPDEVMSFLHDLLDKSKPIAQKEYAAVRQLAEADGIKDIAAWDIAYYSENLRKASYDFSQEDLKPYFPLDHVVEGLFTIVNKLYGIKITEQKNIDVWHKDVRFYTLHDDHDNLRAGFYIDPFARPHKREGAWMDDARTRFRFKNGTVQLPVAYLTCNFMPPLKNESALLTHEDVQTLFHEFGHCLQHMLTRVDYPSVAGINGVPWDAVEFPSQFMENFCWEKMTLDLIAAHYKTQEKIPEELYQKMIAAKNFQTGMHMVRQLEFALFDFRIFLEHDGTEHFIQRTLDDVRKETAVTPVPEFNRFQNTFSHIFGGGYAAGYYSYKWAEVLSADAYAQFEENGILDQKTGRAFMHHILEQGGVVDPTQAFIAFRGRKPTIDALLKQSGITST